MRSGNRGEREPAGQRRRGSAATGDDEIRQILRRYDLRPQKGFSQSFLGDESVLDRIVAAADLTADDLVLEIGPGLGALTRRLAGGAREVVAVEIDRGIAAALAEILSPFPNVRVVNANVLETDPVDLVGGRPYKLVANLPYHITSPIFRQFLEQTRIKPTLMVVMVQREVAERIVAKPGDMSLLAVSVQFYGSPRLVTLVPARAFYPPPKVDSAVVRVDVHERPALDVDPAKFFRVVQAGFSQPRKQLHNAIAQRLWLPKDSAPGILREAGIDPQRRAQTLSVEEWGSLVRTLVEKGYL